MAMAEYARDMECVISFMQFACWPTVIIIVLGQKGGVVKYHMHTGHSLLVRNIYYLLNVNTE